MISHLVQINLSRPARGADRAADRPHPRQPRRRTQRPRRSASLGLEARDMTASLRENVEWRLLFLEFVLHAARNPHFRRQLRAARLDARGPDRSDREPIRGCRDQAAASGRAAGPGDQRTGQRPGHGGDRRAGRGARRSAGSGSRAPPPRRRDRAAGRIAPRSRAPLDSGGSCPWTSRSATSSAGAPPKNGEAREIAFLPPDRVLEDVPPATGPFVFARSATGRLQLRRPGNW